MLYHLFELGHAAIRPARATAASFQGFFSNPFNPLSHTPAGRHAAAACEVFERTTRRYDKPAFGIASTRIGDLEVPVIERVMWERPFCRLIRFERDLPVGHKDRDPRILLVAPMSGHYATLLRGTVEALLPDHDVFITDWQDAATVPVTAGAFDLDDYVNYLRDIFRHLHGDVHVFAVCQPSVPTLAAVSLMEQDGEPFVPRSMIFAGGPIDTRVNPTAVNEVAVRRGTEYFARHVITTVPWTKTGAGRSVYPGFLQLSGFMSMNLDRHTRAHKDLFMHLVHGDGDSAEKHRKFYDEYLAVMDLTAEFYLQTIDRVFERHALPRGEFFHRGRRVDPGAIRRVPLMTIEGENDDITGVGQCRAAHDLCTGLGELDKVHFECADVGHYGIFNGSKFRAEIVPRVAQFVRNFDPRSELLGLDGEIARRSVPQPPQSRPSSQQHMGYFDGPASAAFTFAVANDAGTEQVEYRRAVGAGDGTMTLGPAQPASTPFRLLNLAATMVIDGVFSGARVDMNGATLKSGDGSNGG